MSEKIRYYFHGDLVEGYGDPEYYCRSCDLFVPLEHFEERDHVGQEENLVTFYPRFVEYWKIFNEHYPGVYRREKDATNIFSHIKWPTKGPFYKWLIRQQYREYPVGEIGREIQRDSRFPVGVTFLPVILKNMRNTNPNPDTPWYFDCMEIAHAEWSSLPNKREPISKSTRFNILKRDGYRCRICGATGAEATLEIDHIQPVSKEGVDLEYNLQVLCFDCNRGKAAKSL